MALPAVAVLSGVLHAQEPSAIAIEVGSPEQACVLQGRQQDEPLSVLISVGRDRIADPAFLDPLVACASSRHLAIIVRLEPPAEWQTSADPYGAIGGWLGDLQRLVQHQRGAIHWYEL